ncbi:VanZ family protein [Psychrobacter sp. I-STPA10]|uniref:VanZ family protein n=1 Tax=Psychrobacter sp. I-STPA10 TaxID=2585769 RepID=UPI001E598FDB|nr:VanZ family protein [Psychrobacter sp. I-STPA10]
MLSSINAFLYRLLTHYWWQLSLLCLILTVVLSLLPLPSLPPAPGTDKTHHLIAYMAISFPIAVAKPKYWQGLLLGVIAISGAIELIQPYVNRYGEWLDLLANSTGVLLAVVLAYIWQLFLNKKS